MSDGEHIFNLIDYSESSTLQPAWEYAFDTDVCLSLVFTPGIKHH